MIETGKILNDTYKIINQIGSGGGGIVFKAYHLRLEKYVAIKLIKDRLKGRVNERAEADILKRLKHEGLPQVYDFINDGDDIYTVMEFIDGCSLQDEIIRQKKLSYKQALEWSKELCSAAAYLHTRRPAIIHSDIKPQNIMVTTEGRLCLIDFNISSVFGGDIYTIGSSDGYSPPEQYLARKELKPNIEASTVPNVRHGDTEILLNEVDNDTTEIIDDSTEILQENEVLIDNTSKLIDSRSDVYSIGAVMYSMITGLKPNNSRAQVKSLSRIDSSIPPSFVYIVEKAMSKEKDNRFASASEMLDALNNINRLDKRYKNLALRKQLAFIFCLLLFTGSAVSAIAGYRLMQTEKADNLTAYISQLNEMSISSNYVGFDDVFEAVTQSYPDSAEPYYYKAYKLYTEGDTVAAMDIINGTLLNNIELLPETLQGDTYFMAADILFDAEDFETALGMYSQAVVYGSENSDVYRDYAISLIRTGDTVKADQVLQLAIDRGISEDSLLMVQGELAFGNENYAEAVDKLEDCIVLADDNSLKRNAYILCSKAYKAQYSGNDEAVILENIELLEKAVVDLPTEMLSQIRENLVQAYIDYGETTGRLDYFVKAINQIEEMRVNGWRDYSMEMNLAVLADKVGRPEAALELLLKMAEVPEYEMHYYIIYIRAAYCEADIQGKLEVAQRDYSQFDIYYGKALEAYESSGASDAEMDRLTQLRNEMVELNWLD